MNIQHLIYKPVRVQTPYEAYIKKKRDIEQHKERVKFYEEILHFRQSRYPRQLMIQLERQINPFELSIEKLKEFYNSKFPQYSNQLVHEAVEYVFRRKCQQSQMVKESSLVIEYNDQTIRNGRKLQKEDFTYLYERISDEGITDRSMSQSKSQFKRGAISTKRGQATDREQIREDSPSRMYQDIKAKTEKFNKMLMDEINREKNKFQNLQLLEAGDPRDLIFYQAGTTSRRNRTNQSFPRFRETDLIIQPQGGLQTGRSEIEELNQLLGGITLREEEELGQVTGRSRGSSYTVKINKQVLDNLYNARGKLKLDLVRRVVDKIKKDKT